MKRKIKHIESISSGKQKGKNDDDIFVGEDYAAVIDGVSHKSKIDTENGEMKIARIITDAIRKLDGTNYAKIMDFDTFVQYVNWYIGRFLREHGAQKFIGKMEATGVIYSKQKNQIWLVGDCRAIYDGHVVKNPLKIDDVYIDIRIKIINALLQSGYSKEFLRENDISKDIIHHPEKLSNYISNPEAREEIEEFRRSKIKTTLLECGFTEEEIEKEDLVLKYYNPRELQAMLKNNPKVCGDYGYAVFNGQYTEQKNCRVVTLPEDVKSIKLFSDGFSIDSFKKNRDIGYAVRVGWRKTAKDPLSISINKATHPAKKYGNGAKESAIDDASAVIIEIVEDKEVSKEKESDEGR